MSLESKAKIEKYLNNQSEEIEVDAKEFLECYIDNKYTRQTKYLINLEINAREKAEGHYEDKLQELEVEFESLREKIKHYKNIMKEKRIKYN